MDSHGIASTNLGTHRCRPTMFRPTMFRPTMFRPTMFRPTMFRPTMFRLLIGALLFCLLIGVAGPVLASGSSPADPMPFDPQAGPIPITLPDGGEVWLSVDFTHASTVSHIAIETEGGLNTRLAIFANLSEALQGDPLAEDDDSGAGYNASIRVPLGFPSPYLARVTANAAGSSLLRAELTLVGAERCDWPAGCSLAVVARGEPTASEVLGLLRQVRGEVLSRSRRGRDLNDLYWRLGADLVPDLLADGVLRQRVFQEVTELLPLAREAVEASRGTGGRAAFSRGHYDRLRGLLDLLAKRLSPELVAELESRWRELELAESVGLPLAEMLARIELLPSSARPGTVIVKLAFEPTLDDKSGRLQVGAARLDARLAAAGVTALRRVHADNQAGGDSGLRSTIAFEVGSLAEARELAAELAADPAILWAQVSAELRAYGPPGPDPFRGELWGLDAIKAPEAWQSSIGDCSTSVAVVDTGLRSEIADFEGRVLDHLGYDYVDNDAIPQDGHGHGTHVSGTVAAALDNSTSIAGVAPGVCIFGVKVLGDDGSGSSEDVAAGIVHAVNAGARVINLSLGCDCEIQQVIEDALEYAASQDVVVVAAAGNDSLDYLGYPAASIHTIAVGAVDQSLELASFSNYGTGLELVAPGVDVASVFKDGESCTGSGTSMAAPHVSGVAALARSLAPGLANDEVRAVIRQQAADLGAPGYDFQFGAGLVDASAVVGAIEPACGSGQCLSLLQGRFEVAVEWSDFAGNRASGHVVQFGSDDSGLYYFVNPNNWEMLVKMLDGCGRNNHFWVFAAATTNLEYTLRVRDTQTNTVKEYFNSLGNSADAITDTHAFATCAAGAAASPVGGLYSSPSQASKPAHEAAPSFTGKQSSCQDGATNLCLSQDRFRVELEWRDFADNQASGRVVPFQSDDSGLFYFVNAGNWEMLVKVLDGCGFNDNFWVFAAATTNLEYTLRVTDTETDTVREYFNSLGTSAPAITDTHAFATCQ